MLRLRIWSKLGQPHFAPKAKRVVYLHMTGSPPIWTYLTTSPNWCAATARIVLSLFSRVVSSRSPRAPHTAWNTAEFSQVGSGGTWMSGAIPELHQVADEMCVVHSMHTDQFNHAPSRTADLYRFAASRATLDGIVGNLWPGFRKRKSAGIRRADFQWRAAQRRQEFFW